MQLLLEAFLPGKTVILLLLLCVKGSSHVHNLGVGGFAVCSCFFQFCCDAEGRILKWSMPTMWWVSPCPSLYLTFLGEKGEVERQGFLSCSLVVQVSVGETL